jgi:hypothetical protein
MGSDNPFANSLNQMGALFPNGVMLGAAPCTTLACANGGMRNAKGGGELKTSVVFACISASSL